MHGNTLVQIFTIFVALPLPFALDDGFFDLEPDPAIHGSEYNQKKLYIAACCFKKKKKILRHKLSETTDDFNAINAVRDVKFFFLFSFLKQYSMEDRKS